MVVFNSNLVYILVCTRHNTLALHEWELQEVRDSSWRTRYIILVKKQLISFFNFSFPNRKWMSLHANSLRCSCFIYITKWEQALLGTLKFWMRKKYSHWHTRHTQLNKQKKKQSKKLAHCRNTVFTRDVAKRKMNVLKWNKGQNLPLHLHTQLSMKGEWAPIRTAVQN